MTETSTTWLSATEVRDQANFVFWAAAGLAQTGDVEKARVLIHEALALGGDRRAAARLLLGGAYVQLGRAAIIAGNADQAQRSLLVGLHLGVPGGTALCLDLLRTEAERCTVREETREAVQRWQDIATILGAETPEWVYVRLSAAYANNSQGFGGTAEENHCWGDVHKHDLLSRFHVHLAPRLYLEIGVGGGFGLARALGRAIGVDPRPQLDLKVTLGEKTHILPMSSDAFFRTAAAEYLVPPPDLVFIDGMHLFEFVLRDFMNVEKHAHPATLVVIDDIFPCHPSQATRRRRSTAWTGDVWKLHAVLREWRPDLTLIALNAHSTGLLLIAGLDPDNQVLWNDYETIVQRYRDDQSPPSEVLDRYGAIPSDHAVCLTLLDILKQARTDDWTMAQVHSACDELKPEIVSAEREFLGLAKNFIRQSHFREELTKSISENVKNRGYLSIKRHKKGHILISGTGRSGTTLLVQILTYLGLDTGFTREDVFSKIDDISSAGLEHNLLSENNPYIVKAPSISDKIKEALSNGIKIDCLIIPMRDLSAAAESRRRVFEENLLLGKDPALAAKAAGSLWKTERPEDQEVALATQFYKLLQPLAEHNVPIIFMSFPRFAGDLEYFFSKMEPIFTLFSITINDVKKVFDQVVNPRLIHDFKL